MIRENKGFQERGAAMKVIKRDGSTVSFDRSKIVKAISKANKAVEEKERLPQEDIEEIASFV